MRQEIKETELEEVVGGTVKISESRMKIKFTEICGSTSFQLKNCTFSEATVLAATLYGQYASKSAAEYETACKAAFEAKGWI